MADGFTVTQQRVLDVLADGLPHPLEQLKAAMWNDELDHIRNVHAMMCHIRKKLRPRGEDIICQLIDRQRKWRHIRLLHSSHDGYR